MLRNTVILALLAAATAAPRDRSYFEEKFLNWMKEHNVSATSGAHFVSMLENFIENDNFVEAHNAGNHTFTVAHNKFSHMNRAQWSAYVKSVFPKKEPSEFIHSDVTAGNYIDWVSKGAVTGVKDQGQCGSCWSFSTTGAVEGRYFVKNNVLTSVSEQNLVDCDNYRNGRGTDMACNGGLMDSAFDYIKKYGLMTEAAYPYTSGGGTATFNCQQVDSKNYIKTGALKSYTDIPANNKDAFTNALQGGPVSIAIEADQIAFQMYSKGVFTGTCGSKLDHGVLAVAYGTQDGLEYIKVKNSWGTSWGQGGYILLDATASLNGGAGQCGMYAQASYPNF